MNLMRIQGLNLEFSTIDGPAKILRHIDLDIPDETIVGLVGESGCGKSVLARAIMGILPTPPARVTGGRILFRGRNLLALPEKALRAVRGKHLAMIFQEPMTSLNPVFTIANQMTEVVRLHQKAGHDETLAVCSRMLAQVNLPDPARILSTYPHELSGGMRQRVMIAMAMSCNPDLLIADEPTTALDVTVQGQVLAILRDMVTRKKTSVLFITHDMGIVAQLCHRVAVMYAGRIVEQGPVGDLFEHPCHPYTRGLMRTIPNPDERKTRLEPIPGTVPNPLETVAGCPFHPRCPRAMDICRTAYPMTTLVGEHHQVSCHLFGAEHG